MVGGAAPRSMDEKMKKLVTKTPKPVDLPDTKFCLGAYFAHVINCTKFHFKRSGVLIF